jgi:RNA polymerase sigma factor (TIGR02999 family)
MERSEPTPAPDGADQRLSDLLARASCGEPGASNDLLPLVYDHLRAMAHAKLAREPAGQTLQPTALVHEAYLRLIGVERPWADKRHFFAAAALAMRRILVDRARARRGEKRGGNLRRVSLEAVDGDSPGTPHDGVDAVDWLALEDAMAALEAHDEALAEIVHLRYFAGLSVEEVAHAVGVSSRTINRDWLVARAWLLRRMQGAT